MWKKQLNRSHPRASIVGSWENFHKGVRAISEQRPKRPRWPFRDPCCKAARRGSFTRLLNVIDPFWIMLFIDILGDNESFKMRIDRTNDFDEESCDNQNNLRFYDDGKHFLSLMIWWSFVLNEARRPRPKKVSKYFVSFFIKVFWILLAKSTVLYS